MPFKPLLKPVQPGEAVAAGVVSRPDYQVFDNILYLKNLIDALTAGQAMIQRDRPISSVVQEWQAVYYNTDRKQYEPALAAFQTGESGLLEAAPSSYPLGVVMRRGQTNIADILCLGRIDLDVPGSLGISVPGPYFLSTTTPGAITPVKPSIAIPVLFTDGESFVFVSPQWRDVFADHRHYSIDLVCKTAGTHTPPSVGQPHVISAPNAALPGWLPANHASFAGRAPTGAKFGYNIEADPALKAVWPPVPPSAFELTWNRGVDGNDGGRSVPSTLFQVDSSGLWWMSDCYGDVPWPTQYNSASPTALDCPEPPLSCPRGLCMTMTAHLLRLQVGVGQGLVTSLRAKANSGLSVFCKGTSDPATVGDLEISFEGFTSGADTNDGILAFKTFANNTFTRGPVVTSVRAGTDNVTISGSATDGQGRPYGAIAISVDSSGATRFIEPDVAKLDGTTDEYPNGIPVFGFLPGQTSGLLLRFAVPFSGLPTNPEMVLRFTLGGSVAGTTPAIRLFYKRLPRATGGGTLSFNVAETELTTGWVPGKVLGSGNVYYEVDSPPFEVEAGDVVICRLTRASDSYAGTVFVANEVGFVQGS